MPFLPAILPPCNQHQHQNQPHQYEARECAPFK